MNFEFIQLQLENDTIFLGEIDQQNQLFNESGILYKDQGRFMIISQIEYDSGGDFRFTGYGVILDQQDLTIYRGQINDSQKHGYGHLIKFKSPSDMFNQQIFGFQDPVNFLKKINKDNQRQIIAQQIDICKNVANKMKNKIETKVKAVLSQNDWIEAIEYSKDDIHRKSKKRTESSVAIQFQYKGEFKNDVRDGFGVNYFSPKNNCDVYRGQYVKDQMDGRGIYIFNSDPKKDQNTLLFVGNFKQGVANGNGKIIMKDLTRYVGTFVHNMMHSQDGFIEYSNGDTYAGVIEQGKKNSAGGVYTYRNGDKYTGEFANDKKHSDHGILEVQRTQMVYKGAFKNDVKEGHAKIEFGENGLYGQFEGYLDSNEEICGQDNLFTFPLQKQSYKGNYHENQFHGTGEIRYLQTGNVFKGNFSRNLKNGPGRFILKENQQFGDGKTGIFNGHFEYNIEVKGDYGPRF